MGYNLFAKVAILPKGYYFCAKGEAEGAEQDSLEHFYDRSRVLVLEPGDLGHFEPGKKGQK